MTQPAGLPEGIYFNLSNQEYHDDPALSHSGMTKVLQSWPDYWLQSCLNPDRKKYHPTEAMQFGERSGMLLLQPKLFHKTYNTLGKTSLDAKGLWLSSSEFQRISESIQAIKEVPIAKEHFSNGYPEVAIFWRDPGTGIMLRAKVDYLRTFGCIDFKRISGVDNWTIGKAVKSQGLDIQNFLYLEGVKAARRMLKAISDYDFMQLCKREGVSEKWLAAFRDDTDLLFRFLFQRSTPPYIWEFRELDNEVLVEGGHAVFAAIKRYKAGLERYGVGKPPMGRDTVKSISPFHVPRRDYDYEEEA